MQDVKYYECQSCGYVQTEYPNWLREAYSSAINASDTGIMARNLANVSLVIATLFLLKIKSSTVVDYAGGYGFLVRLLRDRGVDAFWSDPYSENLVARGFEYAGTERSASLVTAFEAFEHFIYPAEEVEKLTTIAPNILLTTCLAPSPTPKPSEWWYYGLEHGQHVGFFRIQSLQYLAKKFGLHLISDGVSTHLFTKEKRSAAAWRHLRRVSEAFPFLLSRGLVSKTWSDHKHISNKRLKNAP